APVFTRLTQQFGYVSSARFTPDGRTVVYSAAWNGRPPEVFSARLENPEPRSLGLPPGLVLGVSSRGELAVLLTRDPDLGSARGILARASLSGGTPREILEGYVEAAWTPDGNELCVWRGTPDVEDRIECSPGHVLFKGRIALPNGFLRMSPDGRNLAF